MISFVYVIGPDPLEPGSLVKIGTTRQLRDRLRTFQTGSPVPLAVWWVTPGDQAIEHWLHSKFADQRRHGEWFDLGPEPVKTIKEVLGPDMINLVTSQVGVLPITVAVAAEEIDDEDDEDDEEFPAVQTGSMRALAVSVLRTRPNATDDDLRALILHTFGQDSKPNSVWRSIQRARADMDQAE